MSDPSLARHLAELTGEQRTVLELRIVHGMSAAQTASALGSTVAAVRLLQHQALNALRDAIGWERSAGDFGPVAEPPA